MDFKAVWYLIVNIIFNNILLKCTMQKLRPILKKVRQVNLTNPTLNSIGMKGIFFSGEAPPIIRDELRYNDKYKDSLQQQIQHVQTQKKQEHSLSEQYPSQKLGTISREETQRVRYNKKEVVQKVNRIPMDRTLEQYYNREGSRQIKYKQLHGFNIISNF